MTSFSAATHLAQMAAAGPGTDFQEVQPSGARPAMSGLSEWYQESDPDFELVHQVLQTLGYEDSATSLQPFLLDVEALGAQEFLQKLPDAVPLRGKAAFTRFLSHLALHSSSGKASAPSESDILLRAALKVAGMTDPMAEEADRLQHKQTVGDLARRLQLGTFNPLLLPDSDTLKRVSSAAQVGHFPSSDQKALVEQKGPRAFAKGLLHVLQTGVAALLMQRLTPAALISELSIALEAAIEAPGDDKEAEKAALLYTHKARQLLHDASLNSPLKPDEDPATYHDAMRLFLRRDAGLWSETKEALQISGKGSSVSNTGSSHDGMAHCFRHAISHNLCGGKDGKRSCQYDHNCPFCFGKQCQNKAGYLQRHLSDLKTPMSIVSSSPLKGYGKGSLGTNVPQTWPFQDGKGKGFSTWYPQDGRSRRRSRSRATSRSRSRRGRGRGNDDRGPQEAGSRGSGVVPAAARAER
jgi:hypothetical protein